MQCSPKIEKLKNQRPIHKFFQNWKQCRNISDKTNDNNQQTYQNGKNEHLRNR